MYSLIFLGLTAFVLSLFLTPLIRNAFGKHPSPDIPRVGGIPIAAAYLLAYAVLLAVKLNAGYIVWHSLDFALRLLPGAALIFAIGCIGDLKRVEPWHKIVGQIIAACFAYLAGVRIEALGGIHLGGWSVPVTIFWILACTSAIKLIDSLDGLAAGIGLFATCTTLIAALLQNNIALALATVPLAGAILGFLRYNFNPATIFLGESGGLFIGFLLGCYSIIWSQKTATILGMTSPLLALSVPLFDAALTIIRRFLRRQPFLEPDGCQIHHRLLNRGLTPRRVALILYACSAIGAVASILVLNHQRPSLVIVVFCVAAWIGIQHLGYVEFGVVGRMFMEGAFRRHINVQIALQTYEASLTAASTPAECWVIIERGLREFGFHRADISIAGASFTWQSEGPSAAAWEVTVPITGSDCVRLSRTFGAGGQVTAFAPFTELLRRTLTAKLGIFV